MTIKQQVHNWIFGENSRRKNIQYHMRELSIEQRIHLQSAGLVSPDMRRLWGPDISHWDGNVNLTVTKEMGGNYVFIKGLDGTVRTRYFVENRARAIAAQLLQAPYQWLYRDANVPCVSQAQAMDALLDQYPSDLPSVIDFEWTKWMGQASNPNYTDLDKYASELIRLGRRKPILYSAAGYMNPFGRMPSELKFKFSAFWFANYGVVSPTLPTGFVDWDFWQFTGSGDAVRYAPGDTGKLELDLNYWNGTMSELYALAGAAVPPPPTPDEGVLMNGRMKSFGNIRNSMPGGTYVDIGDLPVGSLILWDQKKATADGYTWYHIVDATYNGQPVITTGGKTVAQRTDCWTYGANVEETGPVYVPEAPGLPDLPGSITLGDDVLYEKQTIPFVLKARK